MGAHFTFLPLTQSIFGGFSKFFFLLKACFNCDISKSGWVIAHPENSVPPPLYIYHIIQFFGYIATKRASNKKRSYLGANNPFMYLERF